MAVNDKIKILYEKFNKDNINNFYTFELTGDLYKFIKGKYITILYNEGLYRIEFNNNKIRIDLDTQSAVIDFITNNIPDDYTARLDLFPLVNIR